MTAPDPRDVRRFDEWSRELFSGGCTHVLQTLPPRMAQARFYRSSEREIRRRMWWWRLKRALKSREVWITALVLALALAFMAGRVFAEGGDASWMTEERQSRSRQSSDVPGPRIGYHAEPCPSTFGDDGLPPVSPERFAECKAEMLREDGMVKVWAGLAVLLAVLSAIGVIAWMDRRMVDWIGDAPEDARVLPRRSWE